MPQRIFDKYVDVLSVCLEDSRGLVDFDRSRIANGFRLTLDNTYYGHVVFEARTIEECIQLALSDDSYRAALIKSKKPNT